MRKIKLRERWNEHRKGKVIEVTNNVAHSLIDGGKAMLANVVKAPKERMKRMYKKIRTKEWT